MTGIISSGWTKETTAKIENILIHYVHEIYFSFAEEAINSSTDTFTVRKTLEAFLPIVCEKAFRTKHPDASTINRDQQRKKFNAMMLFIITNSPAWGELQQALAERSQIELQETDAVRLKLSSHALAVGNRKALRDSYLTAFTGVVILDICWAAGQHYSEWKRWLRDKVKDGSAPDLAFRAILTSGKPPHEYRKESRPSGWR